MKHILILTLALLINTSAFADEGTHFCPYPTSFHFDDSTDTYAAPGNWHLRIFHEMTNIKIMQFKSLHAIAANGRIIGCSYAVRSDGTKDFIELLAISDGQYIADNMKTQQWRQGRDAICESTTPSDCPFHLEQGIKHG